MANNLALVSSEDATDSIHFDRELDARGLSCPLPFLNTRKSVESLESGEVLKVISTDKGCVSFFESLVRQTGLELLSWHEKDGEFRFFLRKN
jgi:tRNA 2-thiouridine synthesizing protein A